jgi:medium-chain acyl-[acyl-carrier-protein] hydrolase
MMIDSNESPWIIRVRPITNPHLRLFGFPFAGGGAAVFRRWHQLLPSSVEVCGIQLPGRGSRIKEQAITRVEPLVQHLASALVPYLDRPFSFFGHSLGAMLAFELAHHLRDEHRLSVSHLFVGGRRAPHIPRTKRSTFDLPEDEFVAELRRLNGTPREVLDHAEIMELMIPVLRADFFGGADDADVPLAELEMWGQHTAGEFFAHILPGDHFFLQTSERRLLHLIHRDLGRVLDER